MVWPEFSQRGVGRALTTGRSLLIAWDERSDFNSVSRVGVRVLQIWSAGSLGCEVELADRGREASKVMPGPQTKSKAAAGRVRNVLTCLNTCSPAGGILVRSGAIYRPFTRWDFVGGAGGGGS